MTVDATPENDVIVVGAGAAGLAATRKLASFGRSVIVLEARNRIGGRIFTEQDSALNTPVELGAEFIHGQPPEIWQLLKEKNIQPIEVDGDNWCLRDQELVDCDFFSDVDQILEGMNDRLTDESFSDYLRRCFPERQESRTEKEAKQRALSYVSGFNAADPAEVGVHWLVKERRAEEKIDGSRTFRPATGYRELIEGFRQQSAEKGAKIHTETIAETVRWTQNSAEIDAIRGDQKMTFRARCVLLTLPLGVLLASAEGKGTVRFIPDLPSRKMDAMRRLEMGKVIRVTLRFRTRFWDTLAPNSRDTKTLSNMSFLFSQDPWFPTWWTTMPEKLPLITGWAPFRSAELLSGKPQSFVAVQALNALSKALKVPLNQLESLLDASYSHDWQSDPFSRGAYSYGKVGAEEAQQTFVEPIRGTVFFAGEATDTTGHNGTVHGAIASGYRAAQQIEDSF